ncbi:MAG: hypothetical protein R3310_03060, partial [Candidatus Competibacteraceae bacterium]|nr:hypothetical protein [Candidatus Competibacteraceae bacterium]
FDSSLSGDELVAGQDSEAYGEMDLLSVVIHELGHVLGQEHDSDGGSMDQTLAAGVRSLSGHHSEAEDEEEYLLFDDDDGQFARRRPAGDKASEAESDWLFIGDGSVEDRERYMLLDDREVNQSKGRGGEQTHSDLSVRPVLRDDDSVGQRRMIRW